MEPKTQKSRLTRERLLAESAQLFSVKGYFNTTVDDVMNKVGLTKGGFYAHFSSKEDLGRAVIEYATTLWAANVIEHVLRFSDPREQLRELLEGYRLYAVQKTFTGGCFFVNLAIEMDDQHDEFRRLIEQRFDQFRELVVMILESGKAVGLFRADTPSSSVAIAIVGYLTGTMMLAKTSRRFDLFDEGNAAMTRLIASFETPPAPQA